MKLQLRPYQEGMRAFAGATPACALWAGMGLGKTPTALTVMQDSLYDRMDVERWLVVGPRLVVGDSWPNQLRRWRDFSGLSWRLITSSDFGLKTERDADTGRRTGLTFGEKADKRQVKRALQSMREPVHLVSWHMLPWLVRAYGANWPYDGLVLDEAIFAANASSDMHKAVYHVVHRLKAVTRVIELTGAPTPNGYEQLYGQARLLDDGVRLGRTMTDFRAAFMVPADWSRDRRMVYRWKLARGAKEEIDDLMADIAVSLKPADYLSLPPCVVNPLFIPLPDAVRTVYRALERDCLAEVGGKDILAPSAGVKAGKLLQLASGAVYDGTGKWLHLHDRKLDRLDELVQQTPGPVLLAYGYEHEWERVKARFGRHVAHVHDPRALDRFRAGGVRLLCMHPASGGHGLDGLQQVSSTAVWFGATYNADHWAQFNARLHRDGTTADRVVVHQLLAEDTLEEYVAGVTIPAKIEEQDLLLEAVKFRQNRVQMDVSTAYETR